MYGFWIFQCALKLTSEPKKKKKTGIPIDIRALKIHYPTVIYRYVSFEIIEIYTYTPLYKIRSVGEGSTFIVTCSGSHLDNFKTIIDYLFQ